jgi:hypothetical protein
LWLINCVLIFSIRAVRGRLSVNYRIQWDFVLLQKTHAKGLGATEIAKQLGAGRASVYRVGSGIAF